jgi:hypothetical protein
MIEAITTASENFELMSARVFGMHAMLEKLRVDAADEQGGVYIPSTVFEVLSDMYHTSADEQAAVRLAFREAMKRQAGGPA